MVKEAIEYLGKNAKSFEEVRMAIAGLEAVPLHRPTFRAGSSRSRRCANPTAHSARGRARHTRPAGAAAAILRMGLKLENRDAIIDAIKAGQRAEGGWSKDDGPPDLGATYRVMRALYMLARSPTWIDCSRSSRGAASPTAAMRAVPAAPATWAEPTTATIIIRWARLLEGPAAGDRDRRLHAAGRWPRT